MKTIYLVVGVALFTCCHVNSVPINPSDVICGNESCVTKECVHFISTEWYSGFDDLIALRDDLQKDYLVRIPFYALGRRDASIVLSPKKKPNWDVDNLYTILIGGSTNRVSISRGWILLKELYISNTLDTEKTTHFLLEITIGGEIVLYSSQLDGRSLIVAHDPNPSPMHYIGFGADVHFFYGCKNDTPFRTVPKHPHLNMNLLAKINAGNPMDQFCKHVDTWNYNYEQFQPLSELNPPIQSNGYILRFPFYIEGTKNAHILLSPIDHPGGDVYEIVIGASGLFHVQIRRNIGRNVIARIGRPNLLSSRAPVKFVLEITTDGHISLYSSHDPFAPLLTAYDPTPLPIKYLSFASENSLVQYYFMCTEDIGDISQPTELSSKWDEISGPGNIDGGIAAQNYDLQKCKHVQVQKNEYQEFIPLKDIVGEQLKNQIINIPLLIQGDKNAYIALTSTDNPNWETDNIYEFVIGGWNNSRVAVRRKKNGEELRSEETLNILSKVIPSKFTLSITSTGRIYLFSDLAAYKPLIWTSDSDPLPIKYISFASNESEIIDFYYGCPQFMQQLPFVYVEPVFISVFLPTTDDASLIEKPVPIDAHPLLANPLLYDHIDLKALARHSKHFETWRNLVESFTDVKDEWRPKGFLFRFVVYVQSSDDARILLSTESSVYGIQLGCQGNTRSQIVRQRDSKILTEIHEQNILSETEPLRVIVEIANGGLFQVYTAHNPFVPLLRVTIRELTEVNMIAFQSLTRALFFYDVNEDELLHKPVESDSVLEKRSLLTLYTTPELNDKYTQWAKLVDIKGIRPEGYLLRLPFFIQGPANAHVLLSQTENPSLAENAYEFVIGGHNNNRIEIRKRINGISLVNVHVPNVLSEFRKKKFVIEIATEGEIQLYSEDNPYRPLAFVFDPNPFDLKFLSFKNHNSERLQFFYVNPTHLDHSEIIANLLATDYSSNSSIPIDDVVNATVSP